MPPHVFIPTQAFNNLGAKSTHIVYFSISSHIQFLCHFGMFLSFSTLIVSPPSSATLWITPQSYFTWLRCGIQLKSPLQSCVRRKDAFPLCQMLMADRILFLKSLNAVDAASLSRNLNLIVAKKHPFRQEEVVKLACQIIIFFCLTFKGGEIWNLC